jgi:hypothetical protein
MADESQRTWRPRVWRSWRAHPAHGCRRFAACLAAACLALLAGAPPASALPTHTLHARGGAGATSAPRPRGACLRLRGGLAGSSCFGPGCGGRPLPDVLGFGAWQASQLNGGSALWAPIAVVAGVVVLGNIIDGTRGWDKLTRQRVGTTYLHFFLSTFVWAGTAFACWQAGMVPLSPYAPLGLGLLGMLLVYRQTFSNLGLH